MKKYILGIIIIIAVIFVSGCTSNSSDVEEPQTLAQNGVLIKYPGTWVAANSENNETIAAVADPNAINKSTGLGEISANIQKRTINSSLKNSSSFDVLYNQTYQNLFSNSNYTVIAQGNLSIGGYNASECVYTVDENGTVKQQRAVWIQNGNDVFVILFTAPENKFQSQVKNFDFILNSFKIT